MFIFRAVELAQEGCGALELNNFLLIIVAVSPFMLLF